MIAVLKKRFPNSNFVLTLGEKGAIFADAKQKFWQEIVKTKVVDTTGAGDTFTGYFVYEFFLENNPQNALKIATMAAAISVSREGAAISIPTMIEVKQHFADYQ
jgi:ribokinase